MIDTDEMERFGSGFVALDRELNYLYVNPVAEALLGIPAPDLVGRCLLDVFPEIRGLAFHNACSEALASGKSIRIEQHFAPHGRWYGNHVYPTPSGLAVVFEDITAAHHLQEELAAERSRLEAIYEQTGAGICETSLEDGRFLAANERFCEIHGRPRDEVLRLDVAKVTHPDDRPALATRMAALRAGHAPPHSVEKRIVRPDGTVVWVSLTNCLVRPNGGKPAYFVTVLLDVTERRIAVEALAHSERRLEVYSRELQSAVETERRRIAREIHDELGQSLTGLKLDVAWISRHLGDRERAAVAERLDEVQRHLVDTIRGMRRIATELRPAALDELGLGAALRTHAAEFARRADLASELRIDDVAVETDAATALFRIAQEALTNVARHSGARSVRVCLSLEGSVAVLEITDDGNGTAWDPPADASGGFGLVGIQERARLAGGEATVVGRPGVGTQVRVRVPCHRAPPRLTEGPGA